MQKKSNFVKINKTLPVICAPIVLIVSIFTANLIISGENDGEKHETYQMSSMYKQLETYSQATEEHTLDVPKMNNLRFENANTAHINTFEGVTKISEPGEITVLDALTGRRFSALLEDYVLYALVAEMPQNFDMQALMAQAVAIRTYTVRAVMGDSKHKDADVCSDYRCCQSMIMPDKINFDVSRAKYAVDSTKGIIAVHEGFPIVAAYHSSSFGATKSSKEVWGGDVPYLVPVFAAESKEASAKTIEIDVKKVKSVFKRNGLDDDFHFIFGGDGICTCAVSGDTQLTAEKIQRLLGLRSDTFTVAENSNSYTFTSYGFGHGVGMSQYGADALAKKGYSFYEILKYYYTGISFAFLE